MPCSQRNGLFCTYRKNVIFFHDREPQNCIDPYLTRVLTTHGYIFAKKL